MPRPRPEGRLDALVSAAATVFSRTGLRRTQMADVARELGVSTGSLYGYVESKEALFDLVVRRAFLDEPPVEATLPVKTPPPEELTAHVRGRVEEAATLFLETALESPIPTPSGVAAEIEAILIELCDFLYASHQGIRLIDRAAQDRPDLAVIYCGAREAIIERLTVYLGSRLTAGLLRPVSNLDATARFVLETASWFAIHRHHDYGDSIFSESDARKTTVSMLKVALCKEPSQ